MIENSERPNFSRHQIVNLSDVPLAQITLQVTPNQEDYLEIYEGDNLAKIVDNFCSKWSLDSNIRSMLELEMMR